MTTRSDSIACQLRPEGELSIYTAAEFKDRLVNALEQCPAVGIDLSQVSEMDTAGLQLLILAKRESETRHIDLNLTGHSEAVREVLDICSMAAYFGDPVVIPSGAH